ncbi:hypothetical protein Cs7R123_63710 [Catellatospora sp. TT07R-123]|uniref:hypothetical protein n=1 Tax=Catellatospora sp. TT07R-123 TaxID=2733863 RepID=UPI001B11A955|nr:hypothetical protein [Catellatospora sp. TT07R-123]GHJ49029.1 hypothetical protein Cs7R123_63710 [Catellatospora sp. TT07R-123]
MVNERQYGRGVVPALAALSQGTCYWPACDERITKFVAGIPVNNFEIAHIRAANKGGRRYVANMTDEKRNSFDNLVLLCIVHHKIVDKIRPDDFSIDELQRWKEEREGPGLAALRGLRGLTEDRLQELIGGSFAEISSQINDAVDRLGAIDAEAADLLRPLVQQLAESKFTSRYPNEDVASMLLTAGRSLSHLETSATSLMQAADKAANVAEIAGTLINITKSLQSLLEGFKAVEVRLGRFRGIM